MKYALVLVPTLLSIVTQFVFPSNFDANKRVFFQPPGYVFGVVWTILYMLLGVYLFLLVHERKTNPYFTSMMLVFVLNMLLNLSWTPIVNRQKEYVFGIFIIAAMISTTLILMSLDNKRFNRTLLVPYVSWLLVALLLNVELARLNY